MRLVSRINPEVGRAQGTAQMRRTESEAARQASPVAPSKNGTGFGRSSSSIWPLGCPHTTSALTIAGTLCKRARRIPSCTTSDSSAGRDSKKAFDAYSMALKIRARTNRVIADTRFDLWVVGPQPFHPAPQNRHYFGPKRRDRHDFTFHAARRGRICLSSRPISLSARRSSYICCRFIQNWALVLK